MTDSTTPQDAAAMSPASAGSVDGDTRKYPSSTPQVSLVPAEMYHALVVAHKEVARLRLTDAEREAVETAIDCVRDRLEGFDDCEPTQATLRGLLERFK